MKHLALADTALAALVVRVWRVRGGCIPPVHAISIAVQDVVQLRLLDVRPEIHVIDTWTITNYEDVPGMIRLLESRDRNIMGLVFHDRIGPDECYWEFVDPHTLAPSRMFLRDWKAPYGAI